jgi:hypothetical protein
MAFQLLLHPQDHPNANAISVITGFEPYRSPSSLCDSLAPELNLRSS